jgi:HSP20 family protein
MTLTKYNKHGNRGLPILFESFFNDDFVLLPDFIAKSHMNKGFPSFIGTSNMNKGIPAVNTKETDSGFEIELAAPGMSKEDFNVSLENGVLTISSEKNTSTNEENDGYVLREFGYSSFSRSFTLPENVSEEDIKAKYENGILRLELPKIEKAKKKSPKLIEIL